MMIYFNHRRILYQIYRAYFWFGIILMYQSGVYLHLIFFRFQKIAGFEFDLTYIIRTI
jgi:hypothetical protein